MKVVHFSGHQHVICTIIASSRLSRWRRAAISAAATITVIAGFGQIAKATTDTVITFNSGGIGGALDVPGNWNGSTEPVVTNDALIDSTVTSGLSTFTLGSAETFGSLDDTNSNPIAITLSNTLTLGTPGAGNANAVVGANPYDLLYVASGSSLSIIGGTLALDLTGGGSTSGLHISGTASIGSIIAGSNVLNMTGAGTLTLSGNFSTYTGGVNLTGGGILSISADGTGSTNQLGAYPSSTNATDIQISGGSTLLATSTTPIGAFRGITLGTGGGTLAASSGQTLTINSIIAGANTLTVGSSTNTGTVVLGNFSNTFTRLTVNGGTLGFASDGISGTANELGAYPSSTTAAAITLNGGELFYTNAGVAVTLSANRGITLGSGGGTIDTATLSGTNVETINGIISGVGSLTKGSVGVGSPSAVIVLGGANTYSGGTIVSAGGVGNVASATTEGSGTGMSIVSGAFGNGLLTLNGSGSARGHVTIAGSTTLAIGGLSGVTASYLNGTSTGGGTLLDVLNNTQTYSGVIADLAASVNTPTASGTSHLGLTIAGNGTQILANANLYSGATTLNSGTLNIGGGENTGSINVSSALVLGGGTLTLANANNVTQAFASTASNAGASTVNNTISGDTLALAIISRAAGGTLNILNTGTVQCQTANTNGILGGWATVGGTNFATSASDGLSEGAITALTTYNAINSANDTTTTDNNLETTSVNLGTGNTTINSLTISDSTSGHTLALGAHNLTFSYAGATSLGGLLYSGASNFSITGTGVIGAGTAGEFVTNVYTGGNLTIGSPIISATATAGSLTKTGTGTLTLSSIASGYTGGTNIYAGTLMITAASVASNAGPVGSGIITVNGGTLGGTGYIGNSSGGSVGAIAVINGNITAGLNTTTTTTGTLTDYSTNGVTLKAGTGYIWNVSNSGSDLLATDKLILGGGGTSALTPGSPLTIYIQGNSQAVAGTQIGYVIATSTAAAIPINGIDDSNGTVIPTGAGQDFVLNTSAYNDTANPPSDIWSLQVQQNGVSGQELVLVESTPEPGLLSILAITSLGLLCRRQKGRDR